VERLRAYVDPVQDEHSMLPEEELYEPGRQASHREAATTPEYVPASQLAQASTPTLLLALPAEHSSHPTPEERGPMPSPQ
jgi:hypothetical protein